MAEQIGESYGHVVPLKGPEENLMKSQVAKFTSGGNDELVVALRVTKKSLKLSVRWWVAADEQMKTGLIEFFELTEDDKAQAAFDSRVAEAKSAGWTLHAVSSRPSQFTTIPPAPTKPTEVAKAGPRAAAGGRR
jgi:hypothetical protein